MAKWRSNISLSVKPEFYILTALCLLVVPFKWIFAWMLASMFHEFCHYAALKAVGCQLFRIQVGANGTIMDTDLFGNTKEMLCALAGPAGSLLLLFTGRWFPRLAVCGLFQCVYNLIPIYPLDGGRAVHSFLKRFFSASRCMKIENRIETCICILFLFVGLYAALCLHLGFFPMLFVIILIIKNKRGKYTCKDRSLGVK